MPCTALFCLRTTNDSARHGDIHGLCLCNRIPCSIPITLFRILLFVHTHSWVPFDRSHTTDGRATECDASQMNRSTNVTLNVNSFAISIFISIQCHFLKFNYIFAGLCGNWIRTPANTSSAEGPHTHSHWIVCRGKGHLIHCRAGLVISADRFSSGFSVRALRGAAGYAKSGWSHAVGDSERCVHNCARLFVCS